MQFELLPVIDPMLSIYQMPRDFDRFKAYLKLLHGDTKNDLDLPIGYFNPMAKPHVLDKLKKLRVIGAEEIISKTLHQLNPAISQIPFSTFKVVMALADDAQGGWTNRYTTDFDSKFKTSALVRRLFCNPLFWVSDEINEKYIEQTTLQYCYRCIYQLLHQKPITLADYIAQEIYVARHAGVSISVPTENELAVLSHFYRLHRDTDNYPVIFSFLYGDEAAVQLGYSPLGINIPIAGFRYAASQGML